MSDFCIARSPSGELLWWTGDEIIPPDHAYVRDAVPAEADLMARIMKHDAAGHLPPKGLGDRLKVLLNNQPPHAAACDERKAT